MGENASDEIEELDDFYKPLDGYTTVKDKFNTVSSVGSRSLSSIGKNLDCNNNLICMYNYL